MKRYFRLKFLIPAAFFLIYLIIGLRLFKDYGVVPDDPVERYSSLIAFNQIFPFSCTEDTCPDNTDLYSYNDRYYGTFLQQPTVLVEYLRHYKTDLRTVFWMRHLWTFLNIFISQIFFFFLLKERFNSVRAGLLGVALFIFSPRLFSNSFYNIKDMLFYAWFVISLCFLFIFLKKKNLTNAIFLGLSSAIAINTRVIGGIIPVLAVFFIIQDRISGKLPGKKTFYLILGLFFSCFLFWMIITPSAWHDPLQSIFYTIKSFSNFDRMENAVVLYSGKLYKASQLPWHYLPVWIFISTPVLYIVSAAAGFFLLINESRKTTWNPEKQFDLSMLSIFVLISAYVMIRRPVLYNSWRHLFFLYISILYFCVFGFEKLRNKNSKMIKWTLYACFLISFITTGNWMLKNHPYEGTYCNVLLRNYSLHNFEKDYWVLSTKESLKFIVDHSSEDRISIWDDSAGIQNTLYSLDPVNRSRISGINYGSGGEPASFLIGNTNNLQNDQKEYPFYRITKEVLVDHVRLEGVFERDHTNEMEGEKCVAGIRSNINQEKTGLIFDADHATGWTTGRPQRTGDYLEIHLNKSYNLYGITLFWEGRDREYAHSLAIDASDDGGKNWQTTEMTTSAKTDFAFKPVQANALRLRLTADDEHPWYINNLWIYGK